MCLQWRRRNFPWPKFLQVTPGDQALILNVPHDNLGVLMDGDPPANRRTLGTVLRTLGTVLFAFPSVSLRDWSAAARVSQLRVGPKGIFWSSSLAFLDKRDARKEVLVYRDAGKLQPLTLVTPNQSQWLEAIFGCFVCK